VLQFDVADHGRALIEAEFRFQHDRIAGKARRKIRQRDDNLCFTHCRQNHPRIMPVCAKAQQHAGTLAFEQYDGGEELGRHLAKSGLVEFAGKPRARAAARASRSGGNRPFCKGNPAVNASRVVDTPWRLHSKSRDSSKSSGLPAGFSAAWLVVCMFLSFYT
jgi:hypothetical protein